MSDIERRIDRRIERDDTARQMYTPGDLEKEDEERRDYESTVQGRMELEAMDQRDEVEVDDAA